MERVEASDDVCGPWIPDGGVFTHTQSEASHIRPWNTTVVLTQIGVNTIIAHLRVGHVQFALGHKIAVYPKANCSDKYCDPRTESCDTCAQDCCPGLKLEILIVIIVISSLLILCMILVPAVSTHTVHTQYTHTHIHKHTRTHIYSAHIHTVHIHTVHSTHTVHTQYTIHTQYTHSTHTVHTQYTHSTHTVHTQYTHSTHTLHSRQTQ